MNIETLKKLLSGKIVDWQDTEKHLAKSGKIKDVLKGIPNQSFWSFWKLNKDDLKNAGVTIYAEREKAATGEYRTFKGKCKAVTKKQWEVTIWANKRNRAIIEDCGFQFSTDPF